MIVSAGMDMRVAIFPLMLSMMSLDLLEDISYFGFRRQHNVLLNPDDRDHCDSVHVQEHQGRTDSQNSSNGGHESPNTSNAGYESQNPNDGELVPQRAHEIYNITFFDIVPEDMELLEFPLVYDGWYNNLIHVSYNISGQFLTTKARRKRKTKHKELQCQHSHVSLWIISSLELLVIIVFVVCFRRRLRSSISYFFSKLTMRLRQGFVPVGDLRLTSLYVSHLDDIYWVREHLCGAIAGMLKLDLVIEEKDFIPGNCHADNVVNAIFNTDAMLCVVTKEFLMNEIKIWELEIARSHTLQHPRHTLILLLKDKVTVNDFPLSFRGSWYKVHTIKWYKLKQSNSQFIEMLKKMLFSDVRRSFVGDAPV